MSQTTPTTSRYKLSNKNLECIDDIISMLGMEVTRPVQFGGDSPCEDAKCVSEYVETDIKNPESLEEDAVLGFFEKFHKVYGDDHINFQFCSLRQAIGYSCLAPEYERKGLLLYLHKDNDEFSQMICEHFADCDSGISNILETSFYVLPWDLDTETNGALEIAVDKWPKLTVIKKCIKKKRSSLFILTSVECTVTVFAKFDSNNNNANHILSTLVGVVFEPQNDYTRIGDPESLEEDAVLGFFEKFHKVYGDDHINFQFCSLRQAIDYSCLAPEDERKGLLLYLYKDNDEFSQMICEHFADCDSGIRNILETSFDILPWDLDTETNGALETAVDKWPQLTVIKKLIKKKRSSLFILTSVEYTVTIFAKFDSNNNNADHILSTLKSIKGVVFEPQVAIEPRNDYTPIIGAKEYHKIMNDKLGDRDYDFFEADEHDALKQKIGFSKFGPPSTEDGYDAKQIQAIGNTYEAIMIQTNKYSEWQDCVTISFVFNCLKPLPSEVEKRKKEYSDYVEYTDIMPIPVYIIRKCSGSSDPCRIIIDHDNRVYESWSEYIECNKLHKCIMIVPTNGRYKEINGEVSLSEHYSPACAVGQDVLKGADITSAVLGLGTSGVYVAAAIPALTVAPIALTAAAVTGVGVGLYSIIRSSMAIYDKVTHAESVSFANSEARGAYLNIVAGSLGFVGAGATAVVSQLAGRGVVIGTSAQVALNSVNIVNVGTSAVNIANSTYEIIDNWNDNKTVSPLSVLQLSCSILFFHNAVINFKTANVIISEAQNSTLTSYKESLRSNRQRKTFNKLLKETVHQNKGNVQTGNAEVISSLSNVSSRQETIAFLTRNNKRFNKYGVKFAAKDGKIALNGVNFDMSNLESVTHLKSFISNLPPTPTPTVENTIALTSEISSVLTSAISFENFSKIISLANTLTKEGATMDAFVSVLRQFQPEIRDKIIRVFVAFIKEVDMRKILWFKICEDAWPGSCKNVYVITLKLIVEFLNVQISLYESDFRKRYGDKKYNIAKKTTYWLSHIMNIFVQGSYVSRHLLQMLVDWIIKESINSLEYSLKLRKRIPNAKKENTCTICGGTFTTI